MKTAIVWFKTDLRLYDNSTCKSNRTRRKSVYCFDDADFVTTRYGFKKTGNRAQFFIRVV
jgi:deoxyribodipyrimidine photo-lyase